jgi:hypothetical protein
VSTIRRLRGLASGFCPGRRPSLATSTSSRVSPRSSLPPASTSPVEPGHGLIGRCTGCSYRSACGGGCVATRWRYEKDTQQYTHRAPHPGSCHADVNGCSGYRRGLPYPVPGQRAAGDARRDWTLRSAPCGHARTAR